MSLANHKINSFLKQKKRWSATLSEIKSQPDRLLIMILIGNNLVNIYAAALATQISLTLAQNSNIEQSLAVALATWVITFLILVFWEIVPKSFAIKNAESIALRVSFIYKILLTLFFPLIYVLEKLIRLFTGKWNVSKAMSWEEIETFLDMWRSSGALEDEEHERLKNTLEFSETLIEEVMIPRVRLDAVSDDTTIEEALDYYLNHTHSRIPVYHETIDKIIWIFTIRDLLREQNQWNHQKLLKDIKFAEIIKVPINQPIDILLNTFQYKRQHIAIVMDEYGWVAGIVTLEDIVEEIFWDIRDETDKETPDVIKKWKNLYHFDASILIDEALDVFHMTFEEIGLDEKEFSGETLSYIITHELERFAEAGEEICFSVWEEETTQKRLCFTVIELEDGSVKQVEAKLK